MNQLARIRYEYKALNQQEIIALKNKLQAQTRHRLALFREDHQILISCKCIRSISTCSFRALFRLESANKYFLSEFISQNPQKTQAQREAAEMSSRIQLINQLRVKMATLLQQQYCSQIKLNPKNMIAVMFGEQGRQIFREGLGIMSRRKVKKHFDNTLNALKRSLTKAP